MSQVLDITLRVIFKQINNQMAQQAISSQLNQDEFLYISAEGLNRIANLFDPNEPTKNIVWTTDYTVELPIILKKEGPGIYPMFHNFLYTRF